LATSAGPGTVTLTVENSGEELSARLVPALTEPFRRGDERVRNDHSGVGLGLAIVKTIAEAHDGTLTTVARAGGGLHVTVRLPAGTGATRYGPVPR
jgi:two-component system sensor histidine kinase VanS